MGSKRVVITGLGAITPIGKNVNEYQNSLFSGLSGCENIISFDTSKFKTKFACEIKGYNPEDYFERKEARKMDRFAQYALVSVDEAIKDSGLNIDSLNKNKSGVIWGSGIGGLKTFQDEVLSFGDGNGTPRFNPFFIPKMISDIAPVSYTHLTLPTKPSG